MTMADNKHRFVIVVSILLTNILSTSADYDPTKCTLDPGTTSGNLEIPTFRDNYYAFEETKLIGNNGFTPQGDYISNTDLYFSKNAEAAHFYTSALGNKTYSYIQPKEDQFFQASSGPQGQSCKAMSLEGSVDATYLNVTDINGVIQLGSPAMSMQFGRGQMSIVKRPDTFLSDRGIAVNVYETCAYYPTADSTAKITWMFSDESSWKMPNSSTSLLVMSDMVGYSNLTKTSWHVRTDYTHNVFGVHPSNNSNFEIPSNLLCANGVNARPPTIPQYFRYKGEQVEQYKGTQTDAVYLNYFQETFLVPLGLYTKESESVAPPGSPGNEVSYNRQVSDFNTGLEYVLDLKSGACTIMQIPSTPGANNAAVPTSNGNVKMRTSSQFFGLDSNAYQNLGLHLHKDRGIPSEVYTTYFGNSDFLGRGGSLFSWFFADAAWQQQNGYAPPYTMPVDLHVETEDIKILMNVFEYATKMDKDIPDVSLCYGSNTSIPVEFYFNGNYSQAVAPDPYKFKSLFLLNIMTTDGIQSPIRIANIDVSPASDTQIVVRFLLLDKPPKAGNVDTPINEISAADALNKLKSNVASGKFFVQIVSDDFSSSVSVYASAVGSFDRGKFHEVRVKMAGASGGFSAGALAGVVIGCLLLGLLLGGVALVLFKKFRHGGILGNSAGTERLAEDMKY